MTRSSTWNAKSATTKAGMLFRLFPVVAVGLCFAYSWAVEVSVDLWTWPSHIHISKSLTIYLYKYVYIVYSHCCVESVCYRCVPSLFGELCFCRVWSLCFIMLFCRRLCLWSACRPSSQEPVLGVQRDSQLKGLCLSGTAQAHTHT